MTDYQREKTNYRFWESCKNLADSYVYRLMIRLKHTMPNPILLDYCVDVTSCEELCASGLMYVLNYAANYKHYHLVIKNDKLTASYLYKYLNAIHSNDDNCCDIYANDSYKKILISVISISSYMKIDSNIDTILALVLSLDQIEP